MIQSAGELDVIGRAVALVFGISCLTCAHAADGALARQQAAAALQKGDVASAESMLRGALKDGPNDAETLSLLAYTLDIGKKFPEADSMYRRALALAPRSVPVLGRYANHLLLSGDAKGARRAFEQVVAIDPADYYANLELAQMALKAKDADHAREALRYLARLHQNQRDAPDVAVQRIVALDRCGDKAAADALFTHLSSATESDAKLSASIGWALAQGGDYDRAETFLTHALAADPSNFQVLYDLGAVAVYAGHYERAREVLESALRQQPDNVDVLYSLAFVYSALKQPEAALRLAARAVKLAPQRADAQRLVALTTGELQANDDSAAAWDRYMALAPNDDTGRRERGFARIHLRQFDTGIADLEWYIGRHPDDPVGYYELGLAQSTRDPTKGLASLDRALQLKPDFLEARAARGALHYLQGNAEAAVPDLEAAVVADPNNGLVLDRLGEAYRSLDRLNDAIRALRKASALAPDEATIQLHLANALAEAGQDAESEVLMDRYRQRRPTQAPRDLMRYLSLTPDQQRADYRARVEKAVRDNPGDANAQLHYLKLSLEDGRVEQAASAARAIAGMKAGAAVLADAGRALLAARQYSSAKVLLEQAAASDPSAGLELEVSVAAFQTGGPAEGLRLLARVPESRRNADYYLASAQMLDASGKTEDAVATLDRAIRAAPGRSDLYWQTAVFQAKSGHTAEALKLLDEAEQALPQDPQFAVLRATLLESEGRTRDAEHLLDVVQRRWPEGAPVWVARGIIQASHGQFNEARRALETAISLGAHSPEVWSWLADASLRAQPARMRDAEAAIGEALKLAPDDPGIKTLADKIRKRDLRAETPDPTRLFRARPPQEW